MTASSYGKVAFGVDLANGIVDVMVTPPFGLAESAVSAKIPLLDILDVAARATLAINAAHREAIAVRSGQLSIVKPQ